MSYLAEKFNAARRILMLPHPRGEAHAIADAFFEISLSLGHVEPEQHPDSAQQLLRLKALMGTTEGDTGAWYAKAKGFTVEERREVSSLIDFLASRFAAEATRAAQ